MSAPDLSHVPHWPKWLVDTLAPIYVVLIFGLPLALLFAAGRAIGDGWGIACLVLFGPVAYAVLFMLTAGLLSRPHHVGIVKGRFPRDSGHRVYGHRKLYGLCWTALYYCKPVYWICLTVPWLKWAMFRLFGYKGSVDFAIYPDTWIRDLPLLDVGSGAYLSNRATLGTNVVMRDGSIMVGPIKIGEGALIGHLSLFGLDSTIGRNAQIGVAAKMGMLISVKDGAVVGSGAGIDHGARIGADARIGSVAYVGPGTSVGSGEIVPSGEVRDRRTPASAPVRAVE